MSAGSAYLWVFGIPIAVVVVIISMAWAAEHRRSSLIAKTGRRATGRVVATGVDEGDGMTGPNYWVKVEYPYDSDLIVVTRTMSQREQQRYRAGQRIGLTYSATRPRVVRLD